MSKGAKLLEIVYVESQEVRQVFCGVGDGVRAQDWAEEQFPYPERPSVKGLEPAEVDLVLGDYRIARAAVDARRQQRAGLYTIFLGAQRAKLPGSDGDWLDWLELVSMPDDEDEDEAEVPEQGESSGPSNGA